VLVLISAAAASLGGTSGLAWMHNYLRYQKWFPPVPAPALLAAAAVVALIFIVVLGRTVHF
jgi:hypothetical protein